MIQNEQILKYLNNQMTKKELIVFNEMLKDKENYRLLKEFLITHHYIELSHDKFDDKVAFLLFANKIREEQKAKAATKTRILHYLTYAAIFAGLLFLVSKDVKSVTKPETEITLKIDNNFLKKIKINEETSELKNADGVVIAVQHKNKLIYSPNQPSENTISKHINTLTIPNGKTFELVLADGTEVFINAGSKLTYPSSFTDESIRKVQLEGEAYFKVAKNKNQPFLVYTDHLNAEVLGTEFNISSYKNDPFAQLTLVEGSVGAFANKQRWNINTDIKLKPNQMVRFDKTGAPTTVTSVTTSQYTAWMDGIFIFENESFKGIARKLERRFDIKIQIDHPNLANQKFTGEFDIESLEQILTVFQQTTPFNFIIKDQKITINKKQE